MLRAAAASLGCASARGRCQTHVTKSALPNLIGSFSDEQKKTADERLAPQMGMMPMMQGRMGSMPMQGGK